MDWSGLNEAALNAEAEEGPHGRRVVRLFHPEPGAEAWAGLYGGAPIEAGKPAYQFSDGETVTI